MAPCGSFSRRSTAASGCERSGPTTVSPRAIFDSLLISRIRFFSSEWRQDCNLAAMLFQKGTRMSCVLQRLFVFCAISLVTGTLVVTTGCDKGIRRITVKGTVTYDGKPVNSGLLKFSGPNGAYSAANVGEGGK